MRSLVVLLLLVTVAHAEPGARTGDIAVGATTAIDKLGTGGAASGGLAWHVNERLAVGARASLFVRAGEAITRLVLGPSAQVWIDKRTFVMAGVGYANIYAETLHAAESLHSWAGALRLGTSFGNLTLGLEANITPYVEGRRCFTYDAGGLILAALVGYQPR
jgi:hypothetical protein